VKATAAGAGARTVTLTVTGREREREREKATATATATGRATGRATGTGTGTGRTTWILSASATLMPTWTLRTRAAASGRPPMRIARPSPSSALVTAKGIPRTTAAGG
jgi:hypothetical protein